MSRRLVSDVQLTTVVKEIEATINSRPLVYVGDDVNSMITLTPSHFLTLNPYIGVPEIEYEELDPNYLPTETSTHRLLKIWKKGQKILDSFWKIWWDEYLLSLRERKQTKLKCSRIQSPYVPNIGDIVLITDAVPRGMWKLGTLIRSIRSSDGEFRSAKVNISNGKTIGRPLNLLYPLEIEEKCNDKEDCPKEIVANQRPCRSSSETAKRKIKEYFSE